MTKFNPENKKVLTYRESLAPAMEITEEADAMQYKRELIAYTQRQIDKEPKSAGQKTAEEIVKINLGYFAGYYGDDVRRRVESLFSCSHPFFGSIEEKGSPTAQEAFKAGMDSANQPPTP